MHIFTYPSSPLTGFLMPHIEKGGFLPYMSEHVGASLEYLVHKKVKTLWKLLKAHFPIRTALLTATNTAQTHSPACIFDFRFLTYL
jgi:hypothetical protein